MLDAGAAEAHPLMQDAAFAAALAQCGQATLHLPNGQLLLTRRIAGVPIGMLPRAAPPPDLADQLCAVGWHRKPVILSPEVNCAMPRTIKLAAPRRRAVLDLTQEPTRLRNRLHGKWRNQLVRAEKSGLHISAGRLPPDPHHALLMAETFQARARRYANWPAPLTAAFASAAPAQTHLISARYKGKQVAHMLFLQHGAAATYHIGHTSPVGRQHAAHNLVLWAAVERLARLGCVQLDLGLIDPRTPGLNRFKLRTGATVVATGGSHLYWRPFARS